MGVGLFSPTISLGGCGLFGCLFLGHVEVATATACQQHGHGSTNDDELLLTAFGGFAFGWGGGGWCG
jgi:hypothetical protein